MFYLLESIIFNNNNTKCDTPNYNKQKVKLIIAVNKQVFSFLRKKSVFIYLQYTHYAILTLV